MWRRMAGRTVAATPLEAPALPPRLVLTVAVVSVGVSAILIRLVEDAPALTIAFYRLGITTLILGPLAWTRHRADFGRLSRRDLAVAVLVGVVLAVHFGTWIESLFHTSVASSVIIVSLEAILAAIGAAWFFGERLPRRDWALIGVAFIGVSLIALADADGAALQAAPRALYGDGLAFIGAIAAAIYLVAGRRLRQRVPLLVYVTIVYGVCSVVLFAAALWRHDPLAGFAPRTWLLFLLMAIVPTIGGHTGFNWCLRYLPAATVSTAILGEPIIAALLAAALFHEIPPPLALLGGILALVGIVGVVRDRTPRPDASGEVAGPA